jgi:hypothetical protein
LTDRITDRQQTKITERQTHEKKITDMQTKIETDVKIDRQKITDIQTKIERQTLKETDRHWQQSDVH